MKAEFELTLFDDSITKNKTRALSRLEAMFDDARNPLPPEYYWFSDRVPFGSTVRVTLEIVPLNGAMPSKGYYELVRHPRDGIVTPRRLWKAWQIADNWRVHQRLPRLAAFGKRIGLIKHNAEKELQCPC